MTTENEKIVLSAIESLSDYDFNSREDFERHVLVRSLTIQSMLRDDSPIMRTLDSVRLYAHIDDVEFENRSKRYLITFTCPGEDSEPEQIRTPRTDTPAGKLIEPIVRDAAGHWAIIFKNNEPAAQVRGKATPSSGYRVTPWIELVGGDRDD